MKEENRISPFKNDPFSAIAEAFAKLYSKEYFVFSCYHVCQFVREYLCGVFDG